MRIGILGPVSTDSVAHLLPPLPPGTVRGVSSAPVLGTLIESLLDLGHEVVAYTLVHAEMLPEPVQRFGSGRFALVQCQGRAHTFRFSGGRPGRALDGFHVERQRLLEAMSADRLDVVHAHWLYEYAAAALDQADAPSVITAHDDPWRVLRHMPSLYRLGRFLLARRVMLRATEITAVSPTLARRIARFAGRPVEVVANPLPGSLPARSMDDARDLARIGVVLNGWSTLKNGRAALQAFARLRTRMPQAQLVMFGTDHEPDGPAQRWALAQGLAQGVQFVGELRRGELLQRMATLDTLLHPSVEESFGLVLAEAMAMGVPVVAGERSGAVPWLLQHGQCGQLVDVDDVQAVSDALHDTLTVGTATAQRVAAARDRVAVLCAAREVAQSYEACYRRAIGRARGVASGVTGAPLRVLHVLNTLMPSGAEVMLRNAGPHWARHGLRCGVLALGEQAGPFAAELRHAGYDVHHLCFAPTRRFVREFQALLRAEGVDVVHLHAERASMWLALAARMAGVAQVVRTVHGNFLFDGWLRWRRTLSRAVMRALGTRQISISETVRATERQRFGNRSLLIANWFDSVRILPLTPERRRAARAALGLPEERFVLVSVGNCSPVKNHVALIEALARLRRPDWHYMHIGCEQDGQPEQALAEHLGVADRIAFLGSQGDVRPFLDAADLYVMPSLREGMSIAALEAIGTGVPALLGDVPGLRELARAFPAVATSAVDATSLASALDHAMTGAARARRSAALADAASARERYGLERGIAAYAQVYRGGERSASPPQQQSAPAATEAG